jgi:hypothetical protein
MARIDEACLGRGRIYATPPRAARRCSSSPTPAPRRRGTKEMAEQRGTVAGRGRLRSLPRLVYFLPGA